VKKINILIYKSYIGPLFLTFLISLFVLLMQFLWKWIEDFIGKGLEWYVVAEILLYASASLVPMALPLAVLLASVMTYGNLGEHYELTAMKASGISLPKAMQPLIYVTVAISIGAFFFSNNVLPYTNLKMARGLYDVTHQRPEVSIKEGVFNNDIEGYSIKVARKSKTTSMMYDFIIYDHTARQGNPDVFLADSGTLVISSSKKYMYVTLYSGETFSEMPEKNPQQKEFPHRHDKFSRQTMVFEMQGFDFQESDEAIFKSNFQMMNLAQLDTVIDSLKITMHQREMRFPQMIKESNYERFGFRVTNLTDTTARIKDSTMKNLPYEQLTRKVKSDTVFNNFDIDKKIRAVDIALDYAKRTQESIQIGADDIYERGKWLRKHQLAWYRKFSLSFACLIFFFIGAPLGAIIRKGGFGMPFLVSTLLFMFYYIMWISGEKFVREDVMPVFVGAWLSSAVLFPLGIFLTYKASTDSALMNTDAYIAFFTKIIRKIGTFFNVERVKE
jgi:lipopolysaccharide export system permease protein